MKSKKKWLIYIFVLLIIAFLTFLYREINSTIGVSDYVYLTYEEACSHEGKERLVKNYEQNIIHELIREEYVVLEFEVEPLNYLKEQIDYVIIYKDGTSIVEYSKWENQDLKMNRVLIKKEEDEKIYKTALAKRVHYEVGYIEKKPVIQFSRTDFFEEFVYQKGEETTYSYEEPNNLATNYTTSISDNYYGDIEYIHQILAN